MFKVRGVKHYMQGDDVDGDDLADDMKFDSSLQGAVEHNDSAIINVQLDGAAVDIATAC